jgi:N-acetylated-alpha-linked acidic dipeptidase
MRSLFIAGTLLLASSPAWPQGKTLSGFDEAAAKQQLQLEKTFDVYLSATNIDSGIRIMSSHPHHVGSTNTRAGVMMCG